MIFFLLVQFWLLVNVNTVQINQITSASFISFSLDSKMECLHLTMTEVLKRQNSKSKKGYNQVSRKEVWEKTKLWFKQPQTNLVQSKHLQLLSHVVSAAMCSSRQTTFFFFTKSKHFGFYLPLSVPVYTTWLLFLHLCVFGVSCTFIFTVQWLLFGSVTPHTDCTPSCLVIDWIKKYTVCYKYFKLINEA